MKSVVLAAMVSFGALAALPGHAMPAFAPASDAAIVHVSGGCGAYGHRGYYGQCRPNYARPVFRACPPGFHVNRFGRCRPNF